MIRKNDCNEISDDDFISEKQIRQGASKTIFSVESIHTLKGIDKNTKKKIEEGKIYLNDISAVKNAEIEEAFLRSLHCNNIENETGGNHYKNLKKESSVEMGNTIEDFKGENSKEHKYDTTENYNDGSSDNTSKSDKDKIKALQKEIAHGTETKNALVKESTDEGGSHDMIRESSTSSMYNKYGTDELKTLSGKETLNYIKKKEKKMERKRLNANLEALRLQYIPINNDKFASLPREINENILALFSCIIVKHIDSFDDETVQNHLDDLSKKFLRQLADLMSVDSLAYQSIMKPFDQRKRIRQMTGDKTFYELYEKPFIDNLLLRIGELQPDIDSKFAKVVEELSNEMDFWQSDEPEAVLEESVGGSEEANFIIEDEIKDTEEDQEPDSEQMEENVMRIQDKSISFTNQAENANKKNESNRSFFLEKNRSDTKLELQMKKDEEYFTMKQEKNIVSNLVDMENENKNKGFVKEDSNNTIPADSDTDVGLVTQHLDRDRGYLGENASTHKFTKGAGTKTRVLKTGHIDGNNEEILDDCISSSSTGDTENKSSCKKTSSTTESYYESDIEKQLNHGVPTKGPEAKSVLLRDLITTYIMTGNNNARIQLYFQKFAKCLKINELLILRIEENLAADLINALQASINETSKKKKIRRIKIAFAALGGGALIAFTAGLATPGIIAGLTALGAGGSSLTAFLASASGVAFIVSLFGAGGAGLTGYKYSRRIANIKTFEFIMLNGNISKSLSVCVCVSGEIKTDDDITRPWLEVFPNCYCDLYCLKWENHLLQTLGSLMETMLSQEFVVTASRIWLQHTIASTLSASLTWPLALIKYASNLDNAYLLIRERAQQAGRILAEALSDKNTVGQRPVILIGYSMGARVIFYCLKYLHSKKLYNIVSNAIFIGLPATTSTKVWNNIRMVVTSRIINVYSKNDWLLGFLYRYMEWKINVAGLMPIKVSHVENYDVSGIINSHLDYKLKLKEIFNIINFDM